MLLLTTKTLYRNLSNRKLRCIPGDFNEKQKLISVAQLVCHSDIGSLSSTLNSSIPTKTLSFQMQTMYPTLSPSSSG